MQNQADYDGVIIQFPGNEKYLSMIEPIQPTQPLDGGDVKKTLEDKVKEAKEFLELSRSQRRVRGPHIIKREVFDPRNRAHLQSYKRFLEEGRWGDTQFHVEYPFETAVDTVTDKFTRYALDFILVR